MALNTQLNFHKMGTKYLKPYRAADDFYGALIDAHMGLSEEQSGIVNTKLILLLANHIGEINILQEALDKARKGISEVK